MFPTGIYYAKVMVGVVDGVVIGYELILVPTHQLLIQGRSGGGGGGGGGGRATRIFPPTHVCTYAEG